MFKRNYKDADNYLLELFPIAYAQEIIERASTFVVNQKYEDFESHCKTVCEKYGVIFHTRLDGFVYAHLVDTSKVKNILNDRFKLWYDESGDINESLKDVYFEITQCELS